MRKTQKKQAEDFIEFLSQVHDEIEKYIQKRDINIALELLEDCQNGAISLGELIDKTEGKNFITISFLEDYCELIYEIYKKISENSEENVNKLFNALTLSLLKIKNSIKNDIKIRKEIVFLPYKASMWDSLESVWKAADINPDCNAYVIPIPYYDKNPDGSFGDFHYEGNEYPEDVPVVWYEDYDFAQRRPDEIYIHNPYDDNNYVTSVLPFFYSRNLKKYTDKLIYIPYFILDEVNPKDEKAIKRMEHFVTVPGVVHADKVIVQSEDMRQVYINTMIKFAGENTERIWQEKILGLGSPKIDKVVDTKREDVKIPEEWKRIILKSDGNRKKIVLYNTSVSTLLQYNELMLKKIQSVFEIFKENTNDIALLWRPHPLMKATILSMRPKLWTKYKRLVETYKNDKWGIYDDTSDLDRAINLADAYYGDASSVIQLCQYAGIPVMLQNAGVV